MFWNRSGEVSVEITENYIAKMFIDGREVYRGSVCCKISAKHLTKSLWKFDHSYQNYKHKVVVNGNKEFTKIYGITPSRAAKIFNGIVFKSAILPYKGFSSLFMRCKGVDEWRFMSVVDSFDLLEQAGEDGIKNILPFIALEGKSPQELRKKYGKGLWKKLCSNSFSYNKLLCARIPVNLNEIKDNIEKYNSFDYSCLESRAVRLVAYEAKHWLKNVVGVPYTKHKEMRKESLLFIDTKRMAKDLREDFNDRWSLRRMQEMHDRYAAIQRINLMRQRKEDDKNRLGHLMEIDLGNFYTQLRWEHLGVKAKLLSTYDSILNEGVEMHHCVAGYAERCLNKQYVVFSLTCGDQRSTLGIMMREVCKEGAYKFSFSQHFGKYNSEVTDERFVALADIIVKDLNKMDLSNNHGGVNE